MINTLDLKSNRTFKSSEDENFPSVYSHPGDVKIPFIILLHSLGKNESYLTQFSDIFPKNSFILSIRGPLGWRVDGDDAFAWFDIKGPMIENFCKEEDILESVEYIRKFIEFYKGKFPYLDDPILVGFSQGGIVALSAAVEELLDLKGVYSHCGFYESKLDTGKEEIKIPILMTNGEIDPVIPSVWGVESHQRLSQKCLNFEGYFLPGGHEITKDSLYHLVSWINKLD